MRDADRITQDDDDRRRLPYEAPALQTIATVEEATLGSQELLSDVGGFGGSLT
jgi:hypothetical protein